MKDRVPYRRIFQINLALASAFVVYSSTFVILDLLKVISRKTLFYWLGSEHFVIIVAPFLIYGFLPGNLSLEQKVSLCFMSFIFLFFASLYTFAWVILAFKNALGIGS